MAFDEKDDNVKILRIIISLFATAHIYAQEPPDMLTHSLINNQNWDSLYAKINNVTVLEFSTDKPVSEIRAILDGNIVNTYAYNTSSNGLKIAVVPTKQNIEVHLRAGDSNGLLTVPRFPQNYQAEIGDKVYYGPSKHLVLTNWTIVYGILRWNMDSRTTLSTLSIEAK